MPAIAFGMYGRRVVLTRNLTSPVIGGKGLSSWDAFSAGKIFFWPRAHALNEFPRRFQYWILLPAQNGRDGCLLCDSTGEVLIPTFIFLARREGNRIRGHISFYLSSYINHGSINRTVLTNFEPFLTTENHLIDVLWFVDILTVYRQ